MISRLSHMSIYVLDQEEAVRFYTEKLGFRITQDQRLPEGQRWITLRPPEQTELEIILMEPQAMPGMSEEQVEQMRELIAAGAFGGGVFQTADCRRSYSEFKARGVEFLSEPTEQFYGIEALLKDNSGNWFSLTQPKE